ncbi:3-oxoacyl-ACP synthase [Streptomyces sp. HC44]|uniref:3-oxoacyl-ACP synthase n=1 Tax=Streptomyces scabichelini TaxID=2711217 RepID=A0A6G4VE26_9ACTN|nr:beta-ketoacyl synthase N-terminal-like domain-containing protein [Streptomyces scabichelini]NGO12382.1 3-oxoacyl-ACP synthase [Streptomyces scabichelini]
MNFVVSAVNAVAPPQPGRTGWFDQRAELGRGYRHLPPSAQYLLAAVKRALAQEGIGDALLAVPEERRAVAVGTNHAVAGVHAEIDQATVAGEAHLLSPTAAPYFSPNLIASRIAMEHALKGFSLAVHTPRTAGLEALQAGLRALRSGRADWLLTGATEAVPPESDKAAVTVRGAAEEGALALVVEPAQAVRAGGRRALGRVEVRSVFVPPGRADVPEDVRAALGVLLEGVSGVSYGSWPQVRLTGDGSPVARAVEAALGAPAEPAGAGSLRPLQAVAEALAQATAPQIVVTATAAGNVSAALVTPSTPQ